MSKLDDIFIQWAATWAIFSISGTGQELPDIKDRIKAVMFDIIGENEQIVCFDSDGDEHPFPEAEYANDLREEQRQMVREL